MSEEREIDNGGPAFPSTLNLEQERYAKHDDGESSIRVTEGYEGMSLRDYFAAKALVAVIEAHGRIMTEMAKLGKVLGEGKTNADMRIAWAEEAYALADDMIRARQNRQTTGPK